MPADSEPVRIVFHTRWGFKKRIFDHVRAMTGVYGSVNDFLRQAVRNQIKDDGGTMAEKKPTPAPGVKFDFSA